MLNAALVLRKKNEIYISVDINKGDFFLLSHLLPQLNEERRSNHYLPYYDSFSA